MKQENFKNDPSNYKKFSKVYLLLVTLFIFFCIVCNVAWLIIFNIYFHGSNTVFYKYLGYPCMSYQTVTTSDQPKEIEEIVGAYPRDICFQDRAIKEQNYNLCDMLSFMDRIDCRISVALQKNDLNYCSTVVEIEGENDCYTRFAAKDNDPKICDQISKIQENYSKYYDKCINLIN